MEKIIKISGKDVKFKSSASNAYRYRMQFKSDMLKDLMKLREKLDVKNQNKEEQFEILDLEVFEKIAWTMAKTADDSIPPIENWLDEFEAFSIYQILPELSDLMLSNFRGVDQKKNIIPEEIQNQN